MGAFIYPLKKYIILHVIEKIQNMFNYPKVLKNKIYFYICFH